MGFLDGAPRNLGSDEKVEEEEEEANGQEDGTAVDTAPRKAAETPEETGGAEFEAALFAEAVKSAAYGVADQAASRGAHFIVHPGGKFEAVVPEKDGACGEERVTEYGENSQSRPRTPNQACLSGASDQYSCDAPTSARVTRLREL